MALSRDMISNWINTDLPRENDALANDWRVGNAYDIKCTLRRMQTILRAVEDRLQQDLYDNLRQGE